MRSDRVARLTNSGARMRRSTALFSRVHAELLRRSDGRLFPRWFGAPVLVLETVGRRSGKARATPVVYARSGETLVVLAANAGNHRPPAWWLNLRDAGEATIALRGKRSRVRPRLLDGDERAAAWDALVTAYPPAADYPRFTERPFPVVALEPA